MSRQPVENYLATRVLTAAAKSRDSSKARYRSAEELAEKWFEGANPSG